MLNGIDSHPFIKNSNKTDKLYSLIINKNYNKFWEYHKKCQFIKYTYNRNNIKNLFIKMFEFNSLNRINVNKILIHEFILNNNNNNNMSKNELKIHMKNLLDKSEYVRKNKISVLKEIEMDTTSMFSQMVCYILCIIFNNILCVHVLIL